MATGDPDRFGSGSVVGRRPASLARSVQRAGLLLAALAGVLALVAGAAVLARSGGGGVVLAMTSDPGGVAAVFRLAVVCTAGGCWCVGLGLVAEGLFAADA